jgi:hypothetical protein
MILCKIRPHSKGGDGEDTGTIDRPPSALIIHLHPPSSIDPQTSSTRISAFLHSIDSPPSSTLVQRSSNGDGDLGV